MKLLHKTKNSSALSVFQIETVLAVMRVGQLVDLRASSVPLPRYSAWSCYMHVIVLTLWRPSSVVGTGWTDRGSNPVKTRLHVPVQTGPGAHTASYKIGTGSLTGVKRPGRGVKHHSPSSVQVKERVALYFYSPSVSSWQIIG